MLSPAGKGVLSLMLARAFAPMFPLELAERDFRYALAAAAGHNAATPVTEAVRVVLRQGILKGFRRRQSDGNLPPLWVKSGLTQFLTGAGERLAGRAR